MNEDWFTELLAYGNIHVTKDRCQGVNNNVVMCVHVCVVDFPAESITPSKARLYYNLLV